MSSLLLDPPQEACVQWMLERECDDVVTRGGILAEDAGFGKTRVVCELIARSRSFPCLIVVPRAVLDSEWQTTIERVTGVFPLVAHGKASIRYIDSIGNDTSDNCTSYCSIVLTTHSTMRSIVDTLSARKWARVIIDEAHIMRNPRTQLYRACKRIMENAECKWMITATPVQNSESDMINLAALVGMNTHDSSVVRELIMQRTTTIPDQTMDEDTTISIVTLPLDAEHQEIYKQSCTHLKPDNPVQAANSVMVQIMRMRQAATHPSFVKTLPDDKKYTPPAKFEYVLGECMRLTSSDNGGIVIFCNWIEEMNLLEIFLNSQKMELWSVERLEGQTSQSDRDALFFKLKMKSRGKCSKLNILLCQIGCAACGLNLQYAFSTVIIMRPQWNPVNEFQAVRRVIRRGQSHSVVRVSRLVAKDTIDENIIEMQKRKVNIINKSLMDDIVSKMLALDVVSSV
jgi:SNF2 family DNA or RNA helicase